MALRTTRPTTTTSDPVPSPPWGTVPAAHPLARHPPHPAPPAGWGTPNPAITEGRSAVSHTFEITWHGEDTDTMRACVGSQQALDTLRNLISSDSNLVISSVTEFDQYGVAIAKASSPRPTFRRLRIDTSALAREASPGSGPTTCASGVGPFLCSQFPGCGHLTLIGTADQHRSRRVRVQRIGREV